MTGDQVAVLGLGRMGAAIARRFASQGVAVRGWHRSGAPVDGVAVVGDLADAVAGADLVLLSLFDDAACDDVLGALLPCDAPVVNTTTTSRTAAARFADRAGPGYVHCPVLGSVPAVLAGSLLLIPGGPPAAVEAVLPRLHLLGQVLPAPDAGTAAAVKLIANGALAGGLAAVRDALRQADAAGVERGFALDVLERGPVGGIVRAKRDRLDEGAPLRPADFTMGGLVKDMRLLGDLSRAPWPRAREAEAAIASGRLGADDDIAAFATAAPDPAAAAAVEPLLAEDELAGGRLDDLVVDGTVATAVLTLRDGPDTVTEMLLLVDDGAGWRIESRVRHRR